MTVDRTLAVTTVAGRVLLAAATVWAVARPAAAEPIDCTRNGTLDYFIARGSEPCGHGRGAYFDFTYSTVPIGGALDVPPESVQVEPGSTRYADVLVFTGDWRVARGQSLEVNLGFSFEPVRLAGRVGAPLMLDPWWSPSPSLLSGTLCVGGDTPCDTGSLYLLDGGSYGFGRFTFPAVQSGGRVELAFRVDGLPDDAYGQSVAVTEVYTIFEIAEPSLLLLVAFGLGLGLLRRA